jgi:hypothetical protein
MHWDVKINVTWSRLGSRLGRSGDGDGECCGLGSELPKVIRKLWWFVGITVSIISNFTTKTQDSRMSLEMPLSGMV